MKLVTKIAAGVLLGVGLPIALLALIGLADGKASENDRQGALAALVLLGLPPTAVGTWLVVNGLQRSQQDARDRLQAVFFRLLEAGNGEVTVLRFAMESGLDGDSARQYLNDRAKEFNASFNVTEEGKLTYYFDLGHAQLPSSSSVMTETYDVILATVPDDRRREVVKAVHDLTGLSWEQSKALVKQLPNPVVVKQQLPKQAAEAARQRLEMAGAGVMVVLN